jgi:predicted ATPase
MILRNKVQRLTSAAYLTLDPSKMVKASVPDAGTPEMQVDGGGLASVLAWMKGAAEDEIALVTKDLCRVVPGVKRIRTFRQEIARRKHQKLDVDGQPVWRSVDEKVLGDRFELEFDDGHSVPADLLSEGTVLALGLLTKLREPTRPRMILLDDIDRGLHIEAQAKLVTVLRELLEEIPELQIVCTTHSPYLLDRFKPEEVRLLALDEKRHTKALTLTEHPEYEKWKFGTQTGELWAALGDGWVKTSGASQ